jgi:dienelactone hydrolase
VTADAVRTLLALREPLDLAPTAAVQGPDAEYEGLRLRHVVLVHPAGHVVPALFLRPPGPGPWPAVVAVHQHNGEFHWGKSEPAGLVGDPDMAYGHELARRGFAVVVPDLLGFEERRGAMQDPAAFERFEAFRALVEGRSLQSRHTADVCLAATWLLSQPGVLPRLGIIGHSLGGQVAFFTMAADPRFQVGIVSCGVGTLASFFAHTVLHNPAWYVPGLLAAGDTPAVAAALRGRPVLISAGRHDPLFPFSGVEAVAEAAGATLTAFDGGHAFPRAQRERAYAFLAAGLGEA